MGILSVEQGVSASLMVGSGRCLSRTQARKQARIGQYWQEADTAEAWRLAQIRRGDGRVELVRPGELTRRPTFGELAHGYRLLEGAEG